MEKKKSKQLPFIIAGLVILIAVGSVVAYLMANDGKQNDFVVGRGDDKVEELFNKPSKLSVGVNPFQKEVAVKNTGENPCFVRVYMDFSDSSVKDYTYFYSDMIAETMPEFYKKDANGDNVIDADNKPIIEDNWYKANSVDDSSKENWLDDKWVYVSDINDGLYGYFYYTEPLKAEESTTDLINWVNTVFGEGDVKKFDIYVYSETVQTVGIDGTDYGIADTDGTYNWQEAWTKYLRDNLYRHEEP